LEPVLPTARVVRTALALVALSLIPTRAIAQTDQVVTPPQNLVLPNYNSVPVGPFGGLEGSAYAARVGDPSAAWFNPAGLARQDSPQISGSAGVYERTSVTPEALPNTGGSIQQLPNYVGFTFKPTANVTVGAAVITTQAWSQETDAELITTAATGQQRFAYSADSDFQTRVLAFGAGYHGDGPWRYGGGFAFSAMDLRLVQTASDRLGNASGLKTLLVSSRTSASAIQMRAQGGVQYDTSQWRLGAAFRTPGATIHKSGALTLDALLDSGVSSIGASVFDPDAASEFHLPWEFQGGAAWVHPRVEAEVDLQAYSPIAKYALVSTAKPSVIYSDVGGSQPPTVTTQPFGGLMSHSDGVVDISAGGYLKLMESRDMRLHLGVTDNRSPVAADDQLFNHIDMVTWTIGLSGSLGKFQFAAGFNHQTGNANNVTLRNLLDNQLITTAVNVGMTGFIYSLAYQF
jgi:hypothetical protein